MAKIETKNIDLQQSIEIPKKLPLLPIRDIVVFPYMVTPLFVGRPRSIRALEWALEHERQIFLVTQRDPKIDDPALLHAFERDCFYIGALGSRKTHAKRVQRLKAAGLADADIARIHAPIGLAIGAVSPAEIAVAIMAEITQSLRLKSEKAEAA